MTARDTGSVSRPTSEFWAPLLVGAMVGVLVALLIDVAPPYGSVFLGLLSVLTTIGTLRRAAPVRTTLGSGVLIGTGAVLAWGSISTFAACVGTQGFCGGTNLTPLVLLAIAALVLGGTCGFFSIRRGTGTSPRS